MNLFLFFCFSCIRRDLSLKVMDNVLIWVLFLKPRVYLNTRKEKEIDSVSNFTARASLETKTDFLFYSNVWNVFFCFKDSLPSNLWLWSIRFMKRLAILRCKMLYRLSNFFVIARSFTVQDVLTCWKRALHSFCQIQKDLQNLSTRVRTFSTLTGSRFWLKTLIFDDFLNL